MWLQNDDLFAKLLPNHVDKINLYSSWKYSAALKFSFIIFNFNNQFILKRLNKNVNKFLNKSIPLSKFIKSPIK